MAHATPFLQGYNSIFSKAGNYPRELEYSFHGSGKFHLLMNTYVTTTILTFIFKWFQGVASNIYYELGIGGIGG
jgi:hypothetical protein